MKFLCVPCDKPMQLEGKPKTDDGSVSLVYGCPDCGYEFAMLANPMETQVVGSLGVKIGAAEESKCPFTGIVQEAEQASDATLPWTVEAEARMAQIPEFVRPMVRMGIEKFARHRGLVEIDEKVLEEARGSMGA